MYYDDFKLNSKKSFNYLLMHLFLKLKNLDKSGMKNAFMYYIELLSKVGYAKTSYFRQLS